MNEYKKIEYNKLRDIMLGVFMAALLIFSIVAATKLTTNQNSINSLSGQISYLRQQLDFANSRLSNIAAQQQEDSRNYSNYQIKISDYNVEANTATGAVSFSLKEFAKGATVNVHLSTGDKTDAITAQAEYMDGKFYAEILALDIDTLYTVSYTIESDIVKSEQIGSINARNSLMRRIDFKANLSARSSKETGSLSIYLFNDYSNDAGFKIATLTAHIKRDSGTQTLDLFSYIQDGVPTVGIQAIQSKSLLTIENAHVISEFKIIITDVYGFEYEFYSDIS